MTISGIYIPLFFILLVTGAPTIVVLRKIAAARRPGPLAGLQRWLNSPANPLLWIFIDVVVTLCRSDFPDEERLAYGIAVVGVAFLFGLMNLPRQQLDRLILPRDAYVQIWGER